MADFKSKIGTAIVTSVAATGAVIAAPSIAEASFGSQNLSYGMKNDDVKVLQEILMEKGYFTYHTATGYFGEITKKAVIDFQRANQLKQDGIVGPKTFAALNGETNTTKVTAKSNTATKAKNTSSTKTKALQEINPNQLLKHGSRGEDVTTLQIYLQRAGFFEYHKATGYYGNITKDAVMKFQKARGLLVDGIAGPETIGAINKEIKNTNPPKKVSNNSSRSLNRTTALLRVGSSGDDVKTLQTSLKELGYFNAKVTGYYGTKTKEAVLKFQRAAKISVDGIAGPETLTALNKELEKSKVVEKETKKQTTNNTILRIGSSGKNVETLQAKLKELGFFHHKVTGYYGTITAEAVREFQRSARIPVDGIAGPKTFSALETALQIDKTESNNNQSPNNEANDPKAILQVGSRGSSVTELQQRLRVLGYFKQQPTGYFGDITKNALIQFQKDWNLVADGIVTQMTWDKLEEVSSVHMSHADNETETKEFNALNLVADALNYIGVPYVWGGTSTSGFDCSGFVQYVFKKNGVMLPRTVAEQWNATKPVSKPKVGDIVYFETYKAGPSHNGIYIGNNQFIHSGSSTGVTVAKLDNPYWAQRYLGARSIK